MAALFTGGDRGLVDDVLADRRLAPLAALRREPALDVGEPTKAVLLETPKQFRAVDVHIVEPGDRRTLGTGTSPARVADRPAVTSIDRVRQSPDPVLTAERAHLARAADCLTEMRAAASAVVDAGVDAWASERLGAARAERLRHAGRRSRRPALLRPHRHGRAETFHIGRRHVRDAAGDPVVIDWRAPMSRPFYQASAVDPQGLVITLQRAEAMALLLSSLDSELRIARNRTVTIAAFGVAGASTPHAISSTRKSLRSPAARCGIPTAVTPASSPTSSPDSRQTSSTPAVRIETGLTRRSPETSTAAGTATP